MRGELVNIKERYALQENKGILGKGKEQSLDWINDQFMGPLMNLRDTTQENTANHKLLSVIVYKLKQQGLYTPTYNHTEEIPDKHRLLDLCAQIQIHSTSHHHNNERREEFRNIAAMLRTYLYDNFQLSPNKVKRGRPVIPPVENVPTD